MAEPEYLSRAERRRQQRSRGGSGRAITALVAVLALGAGGAYIWSQHDDGSSSSGQATGGDKCAGSAIDVAVSPDLASGVTKALQGFHGGKDGSGCTRTYHVVPTSDDAVVSQIRSGSPSSLLWVSADQSAYARASKVAGTSIRPGAPFASTPVVITGPTKALSGLGSGAASWSKVAEANPPLTVGDATKDRASALLVTRAGSALGTTSQGRAALGRLAQTTRSTIPENSLYASTEAALIQWNTTRASDKHGERSLEGGSPLVTLSAAKLVSDDPDTDAAAREFSGRMTSQAGQKALSAVGFRTADGRTPPPGAPQGASSVTVGSTPPQKDVDAALTAWRSALAPLRLTTVVDVSGSMNQSVDGVSRIQMVSRSAQEALTSVPPSTSIALWEFSTARDGKKDYKVLEPMGPVSDNNHTARLKKAAADLPNNLDGDTGLYDTILAAYEAAQKDYKSGQVSTVAIITDGRNDDTTGGLSLDELTKRLKEIRDPKRPVDISPVAIGSDVDLKALEGITKLTGGRVYTAQKPQDIPAVLASSLFDRH